VHVASIEMARKIVAEWPPYAEELARQWWPGPLTLVLRKQDNCPVNVTAGLPTVAVRMPNHPIALELIQEAGVPVAAPSANRFTGLSPTTAEHVRAAFGDAVPVLDGGPCVVGIESTVVAIDGDKLILLRPGMISLGEIEQVAAQAGAAHPSPGMHEKHYSPRTRLILVRGASELPDRTGAYVWRVALGPTARAVRMPLDAGPYAAQLYRVLHQLDAENWPWIAVEMPPDTLDWAAPAVGEKWLDLGCGSGPLSADRPAILESSRDPIPGANELSTVEWHRAQVIPTRVNVLLAST